jgi:hypothetical protein
MIVKKFIHSALMVTSHPYHVKYQIKKIKLNTFPCLKQKNNLQKIHTRVPRWKGQEIQRLTKTNFSAMISCSFYSDSVQVPVADATGIRRGLSPKNQRSLPRNDSWTLSDSSFSASHAYSPPVAVKARPTTTPICSAMHPLS